MIIWLASYPKSGNTWVRSLLSAYYYSKDGNFSFELLKNIDQYPQKKYFDIKIDKPGEVNSYWEISQEKIISEKKIKILKTHNSLLALNGKNFTKPEYTLGIIYVVRDPRNVITSLGHHFSENIKGAYKFMNTREMLITQSEWGGDNFGIATVIGSWSEHYKSWKNLNFAPMITIRYEDLLADTENTFIKIIEFLSKITDIKMDKKKIINSINSCSFENLSKKEDTEGFNEQAKSKKDKNKLKFFYLGKKNNWENLLDQNIEKSLRESFGKEMKELNYI